MQGVTHIQETHIGVNHDDGRGSYLIYENSQPIEGTVFEDMETSGEIYRWCLHEFGRCVSKMHIDSDDPFHPQHVGWVFQSREKYDDCNETYLREVWIALLSKDETVRTIEHADIRQL